MLDTYNVNISVCVTERLVAIQILMIVISKHVSFHVMGCDAVLDGNIVDLTTHLQSAQFFENNIEHKI